MNITLVTGNEHKLKEWQRLISSQIKLKSENIDLVEIQSLDLKKIVSDKARRAYEKLGTPVIVEDIAAGIDSLNGLPGPFIKFFVKELGNECLIKLAGNEGTPGTVNCTVCYYDGVNEIIADATVRGVCVSPRGENGFGFDFGFVPEGSHKTFAEMTPDEKDAVSHRSKAIKNLISLIEPIQGL